VPGSSRGMEVEHGQAQLLETKQLGAALSGRLGKCAQKSSTRHPSRILFALRGASSLAGASSSPCLAAHGGGRRSRQAEKTAQELRSGRRRAVAGVRWRRWPPCPPAGTACSTPPPSSRLPLAKRRVLTPERTALGASPAREQSDAGTWTGAEKAAGEVLAPYFGPVKRWVWFLSTAPRVGHRPFAPWAEKIREKRQPRAHPLLSTSTTFRCQQLGLAIKTEVLGLPPMAGDNTAIVCDSQHLARSPVQ